jgi:basic membrane lipoprotein Med (substrate-binding protein (PBP1-ABC) superfamily)
VRRSKLALGAILVVAAAIAVTLALGCCAMAKSSSAFKVAFIYVGPHNDGGWSQAHDAGRLYVQRKLGSKVQTTYKENIAVGTQFDQTVSSLRAQGYKMIFATSYGYVTPAIAAKYPDVTFEQATGTYLAKNVSEYYGTGEDTVYLSGMAAGVMRLRPAAVVVRADVDERHLECRVALGVGGTAEREHRCDHRQNDQDRAERELAFPHRFLSLEPVLPGGESNLSDLPAGF